MKKVITYRDPVNDDFAGTNIKTKPLPEWFRYTHTNPVWRGLACFVYRGLARPIAFASGKSGACTGLKTDRSWTRLLERESMSMPTIPSGSWMPFCPASCGERAEAILL